MPSIVRRTASSRFYSRRLVVGAAMAIAVLPVPHAAFAQEAVEAFYRGRNIDLNIGFSVGGTYDLYGRLVARHIGKHIPGQPTIVPKQMVGAGTRLVANHIFAVAPRDGTQLGVADQALPLQQAMGEAGIKFDARRLNWIGNPIADNNTMAAWHTAGIGSIEQAKQQAFTVGANGITAAAQYAQAMNRLIGTKFTIITGYPGGTEINLAMERGEVAIRGQNSWSSWKANHREWLDQKKIVILVQMGLEKNRELPHVPLLIDLAPDNEAREVLKLLSAPTAIGRPIFTTPDIPQARLSAIRAAFDSTMKDPDFIADAARLGLDLNPVRGVDVQQIVNDLVDAPPNVVAKLTSILAELHKGK